MRSGVAVWHAVVALIASAVMLIYALPLLIWGLNTRPMTMVKHTLWSSCVPLRGPTGAYRCYCGRGGTSLEDFPGHGHLWRRRK
jgi:hypothetical protein